MEQEGWRREKRGFEVVQGDWMWYKGIRDGTKGL